MGMEIEGRIKWFDVGKGYGFIALDSGVDAFVHESGVDFLPSKGDRVVCEVVDTSKGLKAVNVKKID